jgi:hypothetical protein
MVLHCGTEAPAVQVQVQWQVKRSEPIAHALQENGCAINVSLSTLQHWMRRPELQWPHQFFHF